MLGEPHTVPDADDVGGVAMLNSSGFPVNRAVRGACVMIIGPEEAVGTGCGLGGSAATTFSS